MSVKEFIPAAQRRLVYAIFAFVGLGLGATQVGYSAAELGQPVWLVVAMSVYAFLAAGIGYVAGSNTDTETEDDSELGQ